jgi:hypothetical protein
MQWVGCCWQQPWGLLLLLLLGLLLPGLLLLVRLACLLLPVC